MRRCLILALLRCVLLAFRFSVSAIFGFAANIAFVNLDNFVCAAEAACCRMGYIAHAFAKPMAMPIDM